jgi:hypothetical protein
MTRHRHAGVERGDQRCTPRNVLAFQQRTEEQHGPLEAWQELLVRDKQLSGLGLTDDEWVPALNLGHHQEEERKANDLAGLLEDCRPRKVQAFASERAAYESGITIVDGKRLVKEDLRDFVPAPAVEYEPDDDQSENYWPEGWNGDVD